MQSIIYSSPFVPAEWIAAHGLNPVRVMPRSCTDAPLSGEGLCPYARAFPTEAGFETEAVGILFTTECDQMRRGSEQISQKGGLPVCWMNIPATGQTPEAHKLYREEVKRLGGFLVRLGGKAPDAHELAVVMLDYDIARSALKAARGRLPSRNFSEAIADFHRTGGFTKPEVPKAKPNRNGVPIALVGGPLLRHHFEIFDLIEGAGGQVVLDATTTGERTLANAFDRRTIREAPLTTLVDAYFGTIPDAFRRPNSLLYQWLKKELEERGVRGILFKRYTWCDTWHGEEKRMKEWTELPLLALDTGDDDRIPERIASRIQAFLEVLA